MNLEQLEEIDQAKAAFSLNHKHGDPIRPEKNPKKIQESLEEKYTKNKGEMTVLGGQIKNKGETTLLDRIDKIEIFLFSDRQSINCLLLSGQWIFSQ